ncbi:hypothetical protein [Martelella sp. HB161492]|uniref:hypothetical protein n=1 Tax=Martelella sp. HB161492 TaxID=2720726 RepID=UPI0015915D15|nr:hypothetical protein [Martelella sp. HB161492]
MSFTYWVLAVVVIAIAIFFFMSRKSEKKVSEDSLSADDANGWATREFARAYPDAKVADVICNSDLDAFFLKLHDGHIGMYRSKRGHGQAVILEQRDYRLRALPEPNGLQVDVPEKDFFSGNYFFETEEQAAEASTWLLNGR